MGAENWPEADVERLTELWADKTLSATKIGKIMHRTRNSILGKSHRLNLPARGPSADAVRLGLTPKVLGLTRPKQRREKADPSCVCVGGRKLSIISKKPSKDSRARCLKLGYSKTSAEYRSRLPLAPEMSVTKRRNLLLEALQNTAAMQISEAS
jgi:hypothetical protein